MIRKICAKCDKEFEVPEEFNLLGMNVSYDFKPSKCYDCLIKSIRDAGIKRV